MEFWKLFEFLEKLWKNLKKPNLIFIRKNLEYDSLCDRTLICEFFLRIWQRNGILWIIWISGKIKKPESLEKTWKYDRTLKCEFFANMTKKWNFRSYLNVWKNFEKTWKIQIWFSFAKNLEYDSLYDRTLICEFFANMTKKWNFKELFECLEKLWKNLKNTNLIFIRKKLRIWFFIW